MRPSPEASYETMALEPLKLGVTQALSRRHLHGVEVTDARLSTELGFMRDQIVALLEARVWSDPSQSRTETHKVSYTKAHPSWRHQLVAELPEGSFARRFAHFFWDIPFDYRNTKVTETVKVYIPAVLPENQRRFPPDMGRLMFPVQITPMGRSEESYYLA